MELIKNRNCDIEMSEQRIHAVMCNRASAPIMPAYTHVRKPKH